MQSFSCLPFKFVVMESICSELSYVSAVHQECKILKVSCIDATQSTTYHKNCRPANTTLSTPWGLIPVPVRNLLPPLL